MDLDWFQLIITIVDPLQNIKSNKQRVLNIQAIVSKQQEIAVNNRKSQNNADKINSPKLNRFGPQK